MSLLRSVPVVEVTRGRVVESLHLGCAAVVDSNGRLLASCGDPETVTFMRSAAKPFQALPLYEMGGAERFGLSEREVALTCASHSGTDEQFEAVKTMLRKVGADEADLMCGTCPPYHKPTAQALLLRGEKPSPARHECSGKHTGMLAQAKMRGIQLKDYLAPAQPVQRIILETFAEMCSVPLQQVELGVDGCSAPNFAVPLRSAALAFARLADPGGLAQKRAEALTLIWRSMTANADMVAGPERFDTLFMPVMRGKVLSKSGAEGFEGLAVAPGVISPGSPALGIALKVSDGDLSLRAVAVFAIELLCQLGVLNSSELEELHGFRSHAIFNWRGIEVGQIRPAFELIKHK